jgi:4-hydroxybenzoate polyprenyltransferase
MNISSYLRLLRPHQWVKNGLLFAPLIFGGKLLSRADFLQAILGFFAFSFVASCVYVVNDIADIDHDRAHPRKRHRPLASGAVSVAQAIWLAAGVGVIGLALAWWLSPSFFAVVSIYLVMNLLYSRYLKHQAILDLLVVSGFYLLRVFAGGVLIGVPLSEWLILTTFFLALFIVTVKRRQELIRGSKSRRVLEAYTKEFLDALSLVTVMSAILFYALYTTTKVPLFVWSIFFVVYGLLRYVYLVFVKEDGEEPERLVLKDPGIILAGIGWGAFVLYLLYVQ